MGNSTCIGFSKVNTRVHPIESLPNEAVVFQQSLDPARDKHTNNTMVPWKIYIIEILYTTCNLDNVWHRKISGGGRLPKVRKGLWYTKTLLVYPLFVNNTTRVRKDQTCENTPPKPWVLQIIGMDCSNTWCCVPKRINWICLLIYLCRIGFYCSSD